MWGKNCLERMVQTDADRRLVMGREVTKLLQVGVGLSLCAPALLMTAAAGMWQKSPVPMKRDFFK